MYHSQSVLLKFVFHFKMGIWVEIEALYRQYVISVAGFTSAARAKHWVPKVFWTILSLIVSVVCIYTMLDAWNRFNEHETIVKITVSKFKKFDVK